MLDDPVNKGDLYLVAILVVIGSMHPAVAVGVVGVLAWIFWDSRH